MASVNLFILPLMTVLDVHEATMSSFGKGRLTQTSSLGRSNWRLAKDEVQSGMIGD